MKVGDVIALWSYQEMVRKEFELLRYGIWTERIPERRWCLKVTRVRDEAGRDRAKAEEDEA